jgi:S1-C subfamily serine protease
LEPLSLVARELTFYDRVDRRLKPDQAGVWVDRVESGGYGGLAKLRAGDVLLALNRASIDSLDRLTERLATLETERVDKLEFLVLRGDDTRLLFVDAPWGDAR